ncbi:MAG: YigZ family protein [Candidatus Scatovivens sp.]
MLKTIEKNSIGEITVKKSKFITSIFYIENEEEANCIIKETKKKFFDARHNCYAFRVISNNLIVEKYSDDGEPSGTAGQPMLNVIRGENLKNVLVIVTRYFGGVLLGTGGLVRAYTDSVKNILKDMKIIKKELGQRIKIEVEYKDLEKLNYYIRQNSMKIYRMDYLENIDVYIEITDKMAETLEKDMNKLNFKILSKTIIDKFCYINVE